MFSKPNQEKIDEPHDEQTDVPKVCVIGRDIRKLQLEGVLMTDRNGKLNEYFDGNDIFGLDEDDDEYEQSSCTKTVAGAIHNAATSIRDYFFGVHEQDKLHTESIEADFPEFYDFRFHIGSKARFLEESFMVDIPGSGNAKTYKINMLSGAVLDVLEIVIPETKLLEDVFVYNRDFQAKIFTKNFATIIWILDQCIHIIIATESSNLNVWTPERWRRKILSDFLVTEFIIVGRSQYWNPCVHKRLIRGKRQFKKFYDAILNEDEILDEMEQVEPTPEVCINDVVNVRNKVPKSFIRTYTVCGKYCAEAQEHFHYTGTRIVAGDYIQMEGTPMFDIINFLYGDWLKYFCEMNIAASVNTCRQETGLGDDATTCEIKNENKDVTSVSVTTEAQVHALKNMCEFACKD